MGEGKAWQTIKVKGAFVRNSKKYLVCEVPEHFIDMRHILSCDGFECSILAFRITPDEALIMVECDEFNPESVIGKELSHRIVFPKGI